MPILDNIDLTNIGEYVQPFMAEHLAELQEIVRSKPTSLLALAVLRFMTENTDSSRRIQISADDIRELFPFSPTYIAALCAQLVEQRFIIEAHPYSEHPYMLNEQITFQAIDS